MDAFVTPNALFFKRNHLPVPDIKEEDFLLEGKFCLRINQYIHAHRQT